MTFDPGAILERLVDGGVDFVVIGGLAATLHGASLLTADLDIMYAREPANLRRLASILSDLHVRLRGAEDLPLHVDAQLLRNGDRFTFTSTLGDLRLQSSNPASVVDRLIGRGPEIEKDTGRTGGVHEALGHQDPDHVFLGVRIPGRAYAAIPAEP
jgi:hypothetical protein